MSGRYELHAHIDAPTPEDLIITLRRIAHHIETDHDLTDAGCVVDTQMAGTAPTPSWSVRVTHNTETVDA